MATPPIGFKIIREMTKDELIAELLAGQEFLFNEYNIEQLKHYVIQTRTIFTQRNLMEEANLECNQGPRGFLGMYGDNDE